MFTVHVWGGNWFLFIHGWICLIHLTRLIKWKSNYFEKKVGMYDLDFVFITYYHFKFVISSLETDYDT